MLSQHTPRVTAATRASLRPHRTHVSASLVHPPSSSSSSKLDRSTTTTAATTRRMFALYAPRADQPKTFAHQKSLPRLPVPKLSESLRRYVKSLKPLLVEQARLDGKDEGEAEAWVRGELEKRERMADEFSRVNGLGRTLQERLVDVDRSTPNNWLDDRFWLQVAYHSWRVPLPVNSNWWILCAHDQDIPKSVTDSRPAKGEFTEWQVRRAAVLAWRLMDFKERLDKEELIPDSSRAGPFDMYQYTRMYGVTRIPNLPYDHLTDAAHPNRNKHITVMVQDEIFVLDLKSENGELKSKDAIEAALWMIIKESKAVQAEPSVPIGLLTGTDRDTWAKMREHILSKSDINRANLTMIEDSLFTLCLDGWTRVNSSAHISSLASELCPISGAKEDAAQRNPSLDLDSHVLNSCAGLNGRNRWFDKALTVTVESNSRAAIMGEHSPCDALIPSIVADYMLAEGIGKPKGIPKHLQKDVSPAPSATSSGADKDGSNPAQGEYKRLTWVADQKIVEAVQEAEKTVKEIVEDSEGLMLWYDEYGTEWIKKYGKQSPDAFIQMAMQLAYRRMHGRGTPTYETASTRLFLHGRTDVIRTYSEDSQRWVEAVISGKHDSKELYELMTKAITAHNLFTREASTGKGFDRHLLGLRLCKREGEDHELFQDPLFAESQQWKLSTSGLSAGDRFFGTGFGATDPDGYGINYLAGAKVIKFGIESKWSSKETSTHRFRLAIIDAMRDMRRICEEGRVEDGATPTTSTSSAGGAKM